ncbi:MAG: hypothetical protein LCH39_06595 [Proteobacteria bacterium]|nr:hypothetical protein [Pseudomonadota bacterium]
MRVWVVLGILAFGVAVSGEAQAGPCDHITNAFQYNECLAKQAPPKAQSVRRGGGGDPEQTVRNGRRRGGTAMRGSEGGNGLLISRSGGRVQATIDPWSGMRSTGSGKRKRR